MGRIGLNFPRYAGRKENIRGRTRVRYKGRGTGRAVYFQK